MDKKIKNMKLKLFFFKTLLLSGLIINISCEKEKENNPDTKLASIKGAGYLPLEVGNYWKLSNISDKMIDKVVNIGGNDYYRLISEDTSYLRKTEDEKIFERTKSSDEVLKFDLSAEVGQTWTYKHDNLDNTWYATLSSKNDTIKLDNYTFYNCYRFYFDVPLMIDEEHVIWLAPDIGFVQECYLGGSGDKIKLEKVIINGIDIEF